MQANGVWQYDTKYSKCWMVFPQMAHLKPVTVTRVYSMDIFLQIGFTYVTGLREADRGCRRRFVTQVHPAYYACMDLGCYWSH